jgi:competence protein ComEC
MVGAMLLVPALAGTAKPGPEFRITVMDVGQGLAVLVETARHALLYDAGPAFGARDAGDSVVVPVLRLAGIRHLDAMVISHHDQDHVGGAATVLRAYPQARLIAGSMGALGARYFRRCESGLAWEWDGVRFEVLSPDPGSPPLSDNDGSCVLQVTARGASLLLPGDIGRRHEERLATRGRLRPTDLVLAPHHGSRSSSGDALVDATRPRFVVFAAGSLNRWGFPAEVVRRRWAEAGSCALDTAGSGAMVFDAVGDGRLQLVRRERDAAAHLWSAPAVTLPPCAAPDGLR